MVDREREGRGFTFFHFMLDLEGGPCVATSVRMWFRNRISGSYAWGDLYPCHQFVGQEIPAGKCRGGLQSRRFRKNSEDAVCIPKTAAETALQDFTAAADVWRILINSIIRSMIHTR